MRQLKVLRHLAVLATGPNLVDAARPGRNPVAKNAKAGAGILGLEGHQTLLRITPREIGGVRAIQVLIRIGLKGDRLNKIAKGSDVHVRQVRAAAKQGSEGAGKIQEIGPFTAPMERLISFQA